MPSTADLKAFVKSNTNQDIDITYQSPDKIRVTLFNSDGIGFSFGLHAYKYNEGAEAEIGITDDPYLDGYDEKSWEQQQKINQALASMAEAKKLLEEL